MSRSLLTICLLLAPCLGRAADAGQLDASPTVFTVLAALNMAGYDAGLNEPADEHLKRTRAFRQSVRRELASRSIPVLPELKEFVARHRKPDAAAEFSQYISFALSVENPPEFSYKFGPNELPPDVAPLYGFEALLARFYREANIAELWPRVLAGYEQELARYQGPVTKALFEANGYLRNPTSGYLGRQFIVYVDLMGAPNQVHSRSYKDDYLMVLTPSAEPAASEVRHGYLHYLLDPLSLKYNATWAKKKSMLDLAQDAPLLEAHYKDDILLLGTESLIKAIEARLERGAPAQQESMRTSLREGHVLTPYFQEALAGYEKQESAMRLHYPELVAAIDVGKEDQRLKGVEFARERTPRRVTVVAVERTVIPVGSQKLLEDADRLAYAEKRYPEAREAYLRLVRESDDRTLQARAYFGLARLAVMDRKPDEGARLFEKTLELQPDATTRSWSLVYLGQLAYAQGDEQQATRRYREALAVPGGAEAARRKAEALLAGK